MKPGGTLYYVHHPEPLNQLLLLVLNSLTVLHSRNLAQNQEAATLASEAHIMPALLLSRIYFCSMGKPQRQRTSAATHTGQMLAQHPIYLSSNSKHHVTVSEMEAESNLDHQLKTNWKNLFYLPALHRKRKSYSKKTGIDNSEPNLHDCLRTHSLLHLQL